MLLLVFVPTFYQADLSVLQLFSVLQELQLEALPENQGFTVLPRGPSMVPSSAIRGY